MLTSVTFERFGDLTDRGVAVGFGKRCGREPLGMTVVEVDDRRVLSRRAAYQGTRRSLICICNHEQQRGCSTARGAASTHCG